VRRWRERLGRHADDLAESAHRSRWPTDPKRTLGLVRNTYAHLAPGTPLWEQGNVFAFAAEPLEI
jgi:hypothetical protein